MANTQNVVFMLSIYLAATVSGMLMEASSLWRCVSAKVNNKPKNSRVNWKTQEQKQKHNNKTKNAT